MSQQRKWVGQTHGSAGLHKALIGLLRVTPLPLVYLVMVLVIPFYMLFNRQGYLAIYRYLRQRHGWNPVHAFFGCYANHYLFGASLLDRFAAYAGRRFKTDIPEYYRFLDLAASDQGMLVLSSHIGNSELCGYMLRSDRKRMNAITFPGEKESIRNWRSKMLETNNIRLLSADPDMNWLFTLNAALADGEIVSIYADRVFGSPKTLEVSILGEKAQIPLGPFSIAAMRDYPVLAFFSLKTGLKTYHVELFRLDTPELKSMPRDRKQQILAERYASAVEGILQKWPLQWYNFFAFWEESLKEQK